MLVDPNLSKNIADSYYSTNTLGVTAARPAAVTPDEPGSSRPSSVPKAGQTSTTGRSKRRHTGGQSASLNRQHLIRGAASAGAATPTPAPGLSGAGGTPVSESSGSSMAEDESIIDILDPEMRLKEHRAVAQAIAAQALNTSLSSADSDAFQAPMANFGVNLDSDDEGSV